MRKLRTEGKGAQFELSLLRHWLNCENNEKDGIYFTNADST